LGKKKTQTGGQGTLRKETGSPGGGQRIHSQDHVAGERLAVNLTLAGKREGVVAKTPILFAARIRASGSYETPSKLPKEKERV